MYPYQELGGEIAAVLLVEISECGLVNWLEMGSKSDVCTFLVVFTGNRKPIQVPKYPSHDISFSHGALGKLKSRRQYRTSVGESDL